MKKSSEALRKAAGLRADNRIHGHNPKAPARPAGHSMLDALFPEGTITEVAAPWMWDAKLPPEEETLIAKAVEKRRREFTAGRTCARAILGRLGFRGNLVIGKGRHGAPLWPEGIIGSISHTDDICIVSMARRGVLESIGLDVEHAEGLAPELIDLVCDAREWEMCRSNRPKDSYRAAKVVFSAKESVYKCLYPVVRAVLDFNEVHIDFDKTVNTFSATVSSESFTNSGRAVCRGNVICTDNNIYTSCILRNKL